jgi:hypothetical protein
VSTVPAGVPSTDTVAMPPLGPFGPISLIAEPEKLTDMVAPALEANDSVPS